MKHITHCLAAIVIALSLINPLQAQDQKTEKESIHKVIKQNGVAFVGKIISQDAREILIETDDIGQVYIPKHEVREIIEILADEGANGNLFATRYFLTTNGFPVKKGENYVQWNLFGPDFQFGVADNFGLGIMTSWVGLPIIGTAKYSRKLGENFNGGVGFLGGTGSWAFPRYGLLLPFGFVTIGNRVNNINFSAGYGTIFSEDSEPYLISESSQYYMNRVEYRDVSKSEARPLLSLAGMFRINSKFSFVFDSFLMLAGKDQEYKDVQYHFDEVSMKEYYSIETKTRETFGLLVLSPGLRFQANANSSFQFGFTGIRFEGEFVPVPIPMVQWFRKI